MKRTAKYRRCFPRLLAGLITAALLTVVPAGTARAEGDCTIADAAIHAAGEIRGLKNKKKVPCRMQDRAEVEKYLRSAISEKVPGERIDRESVSFRLLGIIPWDFNYKEGLIRMYTDQLGGYYDSKKEFYAMAEWMPEVMQLPIAVHELTHALQDQYYNLDKLIDEEHSSSDTMMSRSALVEGDATAVMIDYTKLRTGQGPLKDDPTVSAIMMQNIAGTMMTASLQQAPTSLQLMLIFPYISGLNFVHALLHREGYSGVDRAYLKPPRSTAEILHPERYINGTMLFKDAPDPAKLSADLSGYQQVYSDTLGEFFISTWLSPWLNPVPASRIAAGWAGDKLLLLRGPDKKHLCRWSTIWSDEKAAKNFSDNLSRALSIRFSKEPSGGGDSFEFKTNQPSRTVVTRSGDAVMIEVFE